MKTTYSLALFASALLMLSACTGDPNARSGVFFSQSQAQERIDKINERTLEEELALADAQNEGKSLRSKLNKLRAEQRRLEAQIAECENPSEVQQLREQVKKLQEEVRVLNELAQ